MVLIQRRALHLLATQARDIHDATDATTQLAHAARRLARLVACGSLPLGVAEGTLVAVAARRNIPTPQARHIVAARLRSTQN